MTCDTPRVTVTHGQVLVKDKTHFYYKDKVEMLCDLGYVIGDGSNNISMSITCQDDKTWSALFPTACVGMSRSDSLYHRSREACHHIGIYGCVAAS